MFSPTQATLLRRTTAVVSAVLGLLIATDSTAANVVLTGGVSATCTYNGSVTVTPDGGLSIACTTGTGGGTTPPPPPPPPAPGPGNFAFAQSSIGASANQLVDVTVNRTNGATGSFNVPWATSGAGCGTFGGTLSVANGAQSGLIQIQMGPSGTCNAYLQAPIATGTTTGATASATGVAVVVGGGTSGPVQPPPTGLDFSKCPTGYSAPGDLLTANLGGYGNPLLQMQKSQQVVAIPMPPLGSGTNTGVVQYGESAGGAYTPQPVTLEISVNKCPGMILPESNAAGTRDYCNVRSTNGNYNQVTWFGRAYSGIGSTQAAAAYGYCWAGDANTQYYINSRWTYASCAFGVQICGFAIQQNQGPY